MARNSNTSNGKSDLLKSRVIVISCVSSLPVLFSFCVCMYVKVLNNQSCTATVTVNKRFVYIVFGGWPLTCVILY